MKAQSEGELQRIALVSTPWPLYSRPSIQLGALKAYLKDQFPELKVQAVHVYLKVAERIGYKLYHAISERTWLAESIYAALLYPQRFRQAEKLFMREARRNPLLKRTEFKKLTTQTQKTSHDFVDRIKWQGKCWTNIRNHATENYC